MAFTIVVLPDPDGPKSAVSFPSDRKRASKVEGSLRMPDVDVENHHA